MSPSAMASSIVSPTNLSSLASGLIFGSSLLLARVYLPSVIVSQLHFTNFHMLLSFVTASAISAIVVTGANRVGYANLACRKDATYGRGMKYDGNVLGGGLLGVGMALTGACPGTVLVQLALGVRGRTGWEVLVGCVLGGIAFVKAEPFLKAHSPTNAGAASASSKIEEPQQQQLSSKPQPAPKYTVQDATHLSTSTTVLIYELMCLGMIGAATFLAPVQHSSSSSTNQTLHPITGGILIGLAQASSVLLTRKTLGVSSAYEDIGKFFWRILPSSSSPSSSAVSKPGLTSIFFATGIALGARFISSYYTFSPNAAAATTDATAYNISTPAAILGGFALIFGARVAGGCTSGHGISGMATMSLSSFVTVASMFGGGVLTALAL